MLISIVLNTHYANISFPLEWDRVCRPNGLKYAYHDTASGSWPGRRVRKPTFAHNFVLDIPTGSPFADLMRSTAIDEEGPSSHEVMASHPACPSGANVHEFLAFQTLLSGKQRRLIALLTELGSSNLNFSTEATVILVKHIALQCGPSREDNNPIRLVHSTFQDRAFCDKLTEQLSQRLDGITANWREYNVMDVIVTLALRQYTLSGIDGTSPAALAALNLIGKARNVALQWMRLLGEETKKATDVDTARRCQLYTLWAALLCKRTFAIHSNQANTLDTQSLQTFIECSITLQNNLLSNVQTLPQLLKNAIIKDFKMTYGMQDFVMHSINSSPQSFLSALDCVWPHPEGRLRNMDNWSLDEARHIVSVDIIATDQFSKDQSVQYHVLHGLLLVDGMPVGKLPAEHQNSFLFSELFGDQSLQTYPSYMREMTYMLCIRPNGHQIHIGFRDGQMVIRAVNKTKVIELVPRHVFGDPRFFDFPEPLVVGCFHWLNLETGTLEITYRDHIWNSNPRNWSLNIRTGECSRMRANQRRDVLIDPHSPLFHRTARIFDGFEHRHCLMAWQSFKFGTPWRLSVELKRMQLSLFVNEKRSLQSNQLRAEIDPKQELGHGTVSAASWSFGVLRTMR